MKVVVTGATGMIGAASVAKAPADGYTVLFGAASEMAINASLFKNMSYDPRTDFEPVTLVATFPLVFVAPATSKASLQELIEAEATEAIGAARYERSASRVTERNGTRPKLLTTKGGDVTVALPKLRQGSFFPSILEPRRRIDQALYAVVMEAYVHGVSTRSVDDVVAALGADSGISKSEVSRICQQLDEVVGAFRTRLVGEVVMTAAIVRCWLTTFDSAET